MASRQARRMAEWVGIGAGRDVPWHVAPNGRTTRTATDGASATEGGGEGGNRTHPTTQSVEATILKTVTTTRHVSLSAFDPIAPRAWRCGVAIRPVPEALNAVRDRRSAAKPWGVYWHTSLVGGER